MVLILNNCNFFTHIDVQKVINTFLTQFLTIASEFNFGKNKYKSLMVILLALNKLIMLLTLNKSVNDTKMLSVIVNST